MRISDLSSDVCSSDLRFNSVSALGEFNGSVFRIAFASFAAYVLGQLLDVQVFDRMRRDYVRWWVAPAAASVFGQALDTAAFFGIAFRSEEHTSELQSLMRISYAVFCFKKKYIIL